MIRFIVQRILGSVVVVFVISLVTFLIFQVGPAAVAHQPGVPVHREGALQAGPPQLEALIHRFGFDLPLVRAVLPLHRGLLRPVDHRRRQHDPSRAACPCFGYSFQRNELGRPAHPRRPCPVSSASPSGPRSSGSSPASPAARSPRCSPRTVIDRGVMGLSLGRRLPPDLLHGAGLSCSCSATHLGWLPANRVHPASPRTRSSGSTVCSCPGSASRSCSRRSTPGSPVPTCSRRWARTTSGPPGRRACRRDGHRPARPARGADPDRHDLRHRRRHADRHDRHHRDRSSTCAASATSRSRRSAAGPPGHPRRDDRGGARLVVANLVVDILYAFIDPRVTV